MGNFLREIFSQQSNLSSKRIFGSLCLLFSMCLIVIALFIKPFGELHDSILYATMQFLSAGSALLGVTIFEKSKNDKILDKKKEKTNDDDETN